ncbi:MAG: hypothetical protein AB1649_09690 [Chloroflexota bacterium]
MNIGLTIVKWEEELDIQREGHAPRRNDDLKVIKPLPHPQKTERNVAAHLVGDPQPAPCHCPASSD